MEPKKPARCTHYRGACEKADGTRWSLCNLTCKGILKRKVRTHCGGDKNACPWALSRGGAE